MKSSHICLSNPMFSHMQAEDMERYLPSALLVTKTYQADQWVHHEGSLCHHFEMILQGEVAIEKTSHSGSVQRITCLKPPQSLGDSLLFSKNKRYPMDVRALQDTTLLCIPPSLLLDLGQEDRLFLEKFLFSVTEKTSILTKRIAALSLYTIRESILGDLQALKKPGQEEIILPYSKKEWAANIGCERTSLSRELQNMRKEGLLDYDKKCFWLYL